MKVIDAHVHIASRSGAKLGKEEWSGGFDHPLLSQMYDDQGQVRPAPVADFLRSEGVQRAHLFCEYSPRVTGMQIIEEMLPCLRYDPDLFRVIANVNPHLHFPMVDELNRQLDLGAIGLKLHPVHAGFRMDAAELYPVYSRCAEVGVPIVVHAGTSNFPGARNVYASLDHLVDVVRDFPTVHWSLAHGGRGWSYDQAAFLASTYDNVWIDIGGLPPAKLPVYFSRHNFQRLATRFIFGSDWPGMPGIAKNIAAVQAFGLPDEVTARILAGNAERIYPS